MSSASDDDIKGLVNSLDNLNKTEKKKTIGLY